MAISRQHYGLGSFVKSIGKGVKKFVKSPLGKAAILGIGAFGLPGGAFGMKGLLPQGMRSLSGISGALFGTPAIGGTHPILDPGKYATKGLLSKFTNMGTGAKIGIGSGLLTWLMSEKGLTEDQATKLTQDPESLRGYLKLYHSQLNPDKSDEEVNEWVEVNMKADGGRVGLYAGSPREGIENIDIEENVQVASDPDRMDSINELSLELFGKDLHLLSEEELDQLNDEADRLMQKFSRGNKQENMKMAGMGGAMEHLRYYGMNDNDIIEIYQEWKDSGYGGSFHQYVLDTVNPPDNYAKGGRVGLALGTPDTAQAAGILGNLPVRQNKAGVNELDLRETGGFIPPVGVKEKADDVPAMLSNNEFVFTADAVRAAGGGSVNKGAQVLYDKMKQLESRVG